MPSSTSFWRFHIVRRRTYAIVLQLLYTICVSRSSIELLLYLSLFLSLSLPSSDTVVVVQHSTTQRSSFFWKSHFQHMNNSIWFYRFLFRYLLPFQFESYLWRFAIRSRLMSNEWKYHRNIRLKYFFFFYRYV